MDGNGWKYGGYHVFRHRHMNVPQNWIVDPWLGYPYSKKRRVTNKDCQDIGLSQNWGSLTLYKIMTSKLGTTWKGGDQP